MCSLYKKERYHESVSALGNQMALGKPTLSWGTETCYEQQPVSSSDTHTQGRASDGPEMWQLHWGGGGAGVTSLSPLGSRHHGPIVTVHLCSEAKDSKQSKGKHQS